MILKQKKKLLYALSMVFGLALTLLAVQKDNNVKHEIANGFSIPVANADTPTPPGDGDSFGGDDGGGGGDGDGDGDGDDDGDDSSR